MEDPKTWDEATKTVSNAMEDTFRAAGEGVIGLSMARRVTDALREAGFCLEKHESA